MGWMDPTRIGCTENDFDKLAYLWLLPSLSCFRLKSRPLHLHYIADNYLRLVLSAILDGMSNHLNEFTESIY